ncbi:Spc98 family-domain-containing protein [Podospora didyma]|uniref:Spindle pole body component n=1 Tax=Podospora didyma TaxID=330526 RepID=A0AAE0NCD2_9PEZI|nr:Spc98 family-domain-containing protein [Podospora didyma]
MAYLAELGALTGELIAAVTAIPEDQRARLDAYRESAVRSLRHHKFGQTNQFDVDDRLRGYEEHFRVVNREALADALSKRLGALKPHHNQWTPEVLHFILELSDQPAQKSRLSDLDLLVEPDVDVVPQLTWQEIAKEDGWDEEQALWKNVNFSPSSDEDDDDNEDALSVASAESLTSASSGDDRHHRIARRLAIRSPGGEVLLEVAENSQAWRHATPATDGDGRSKKISLTTSQLLREILFMLGGLETSLFDRKSNPLATYQLVGVSWDTHKALVTSFAECGRKLAPLRGFSKQNEQVPLLQVFQDSLQKSLRSFDQKLAKIQGRLVEIKEDLVVSLIGVLTELGPHLAPLYVLSGIVRQLQEERNPRAFRYLELLFDAVGIAQMEGNLAIYEFLGSIFFDCFQVYLKPIRIWMEEGRLLPGDRTFFVSESPTKPPLPQIWRSQFNLLRTPEGNLHAPRFLRPAINRIFTAGKSIIVLKHLKHHDAARSRRDEAEPQMNFGDVCPAILEFAPFSELFSASFHAWIQSKHHTASSTLRELLFSGNGLFQSLDALQHIYLMSDGSQADAFASAVFKHLDSLSDSWRDRFTLTEIAQEAFSPSVDRYRLSAKINTRVLGHSAVASRSSVRLSLPAIRLDFRLNWPVQIIVPEESIEGYQAIFAFLLQSRRAVFVLKNSILGSQVSEAGLVDHLARYYLLRSKLLWFCNSIMTYLTSLVLAPNTDRLRRCLNEATDVDDMITAHSDFINRIINESCQGPKLQPIRDCMLDIFDLAIKLDDAHQVEMVKRAEEEEEISRLSIMSSPSKTPAKRKKAVQPKKEDDDEDDLDPNWESMIAKKGGTTDKPHAIKLKDLDSDFERHLRFVASGLRGVGRASREEAAGKWDLLAEMLEIGIRGD